MANAHGTRRGFLKSGICYVAAVAMGSRIVRADGPAQETFSFVQLCDPQLGFGGYEHDVNTFKQAVQQINAIKPDLVFICGDLVHAAKDKAFADFNAIKAGLDAPCHCAPGNHDVENQPTASSLAFYRKTIGKDYYAVEHKGYVFVVVNTQLWKAPLENETTRQDDWLKVTLKNAADKKSPVFIVGHYPLYLKDQEEKESYYALPEAKRKELLNLFEAHGVVAVLGGHKHALVVNDYKGIQLVNGESTSRNNDKRPLGFRVWKVAGAQSIQHDFVPLEAVQEAKP